FDVAGVQLGVDLYRNLNSEGARDMGGAYFAVSRARADVEAVLGGGAGKVDMDGYSLGAYWTHIAPSRWYVDAVAQVTRYSGVEARSNAGETIDPNGWGFSASLESGYPFKLDEKWSLEPQAQLIYQHVSFGGSQRDRFGEIDLEDSHALYGRLGARLARNWSEDNGREYAVWARANVWHAFDARAHTTFSSPNGQNAVQLKTSLGGTWGQFGVGFNAQLKDNLNAFVAVDYEQSFDHSRTRGVSGRIGLQYAW